MRMKMGKIWSHLWSPSSTFKSIGLKWISRFGLSNLVDFLTRVSLICNVVLLIVKVYLVIATRSVAIVASMVDSLMDIFSQVIISWALYQNKKKVSDVYPVGRTKFEPLAVMTCSILMIMASFEVLIVSIQVLATKGAQLGELFVDQETLSIMLAAIGSKIFLYLLCIPISSFSASIQTIAEDHMNDILSNGFSIAAAYVASRNPTLWYLDPVMGILLSLFIIRNWLRIGMDQSRFIVGRAAPPNFSKKIARIARQQQTQHGVDLMVDIIRAYHFGYRYFVEIELVLPETMCVKEAHDIALEFQQKTEKLDAVERAFVHVDYKRREQNEHASKTLYNEMASDDTQDNDDGNEVDGILYKDEDDNNHHQTNQTTTDEPPTILI